MKEEDYSDIAQEYLDKIKALPADQQKKLINIYRSTASRENAKKKYQQLPLWPETIRGTPNSFLRSALFSAIQGKTRRWMNKELLASQKGVSVRFTGHQLDQSDLDVWQQAVEIVHYSKLGNICQFTANSFLKAIGRSNGNSNYKWLNNSIHRLIGCVVEIKIEERIFTGSLISNCLRDEKTGAYQLRLDPETLKLFSDNDWTGLEWNQRQALKGKPLALWLHGYYSSHTNPFPVKIETLQKLSGSETKDPTHFKTALQKAFKSLEEVSGMRGTFINGLVSMEKHNSNGIQQSLI